MAGQSTPDFDEPKLAAAVERLPREDVGALPFGAIRLDAEGRVCFCGGTGARLSGEVGRQGLGRLFPEIAPGLDAEEFRSRVEAARAAGGRLDLEFGWTGDFDDSPEELRVRVQSAADGAGYWVFLSREG